MVSTFRFLRHIMFGYGKWPQLSTVTYSIVRLLRQLWGVAANYRKCYSSEDFTVTLIVSEFIGKFTSFAAIP
jgi:hypothetical protein